MLKLTHTSRLLSLVGLILCVSLTGCELPKELQKTLEQIPFWPKSPVTEEPPAPEEEAAAEGEEEGATPAPKLPPGPTIYESFKTLPVTRLFVNAPQQGLTLTARLYDPWQARQAYVKATAPPPAEEEEAEATEEEEGGEAKPKAPPPPPVAEQQFPLLVFLHAAQGTSSNWEPIAWELLKQGYAICLVDLPGHGESLALQTGGTKHWRLFETADWQASPNAVVNLLKQLEANRKSKYPQLLPQPVVLIGMGLGANVAITAAGTYPKGVAAVAALAPTLSFKGIAPPVPLLRFEKPIWFAASPTEPRSYDETQRLHKMAPGEKQLHLYEKTGAGFDVFTAPSPAKAELTQWLHQQASPKPPPDNWWQLPPPPPPASEEEEG